MSSLKRGRHGFRRHCTHHSVILRKTKIRKIGGRENRLPTTIYRGRWLISIRFVVDQFSFGSSTAIVANRNLRLYYLPKKNYPFTLSLFFIYEFCTFRQRRTRLFIVFVRYSSKQIWRRNDDEITNKMINRPMSILGLGYFVRFWVRRHKAESTTAGTTWIVHVYLEVALFPHTVLVR